MVSFTFFQIAPFCFNGATKDLNLIWLPASKLQDLEISSLQLHHLDLSDIHTL
jgi:hypothetical protein